MPGEGQKVERILEAFSTRYLVCNPDKFCSDSAYMLTFLLLMAQTSLHNPKVTEKMTIAQFKSIGGNIKINGQSPSSEFLESLFSEVSSQPLAFHQSEQRKIKEKQITLRSEAEKQELYRLESEDITKALELREKIDEKEYRFIESSSTLTLFIKDTWSSFLSFLSTAVAECEDIKFLEQLAEATGNLVLICDCCDMPTERDSFVNLVVQFSGLEVARGKILDDKCYRFIKEILNLADIMSHHLHSAWKLVLGVLFTLIQMIELGEQLKKKSENDNSYKPQNPLEDNALNIANKIESSMIDRIFLNSKNLPEEALLSFFKGLCSIFVQDLRRKSELLPLLLEKLIIVVQVNVYRNPLEWIRVWDVLTPCLEELLISSINLPSEISAQRAQFINRLILCSLENRQLVNMKLQEQLLLVYPITIGSKINRSTCYSTINIRTYSFTY